VKTISTILTVALLITSAAQSQEWLDVSGSINFDVGGGKTNDGDWSRNDLKVQDAELRFEILAREGVKLVVKAELESLLNQSINDEQLNAELGKILEEAYIQIETDKLGLPRAVVTVGKHRMAFGQRLAELPMFKDSLLYKLNNEEEMIGLTVSLPANFFQIVDEVAFSMYETGAGDMKFSDERGYSIQLSKRLSDQIKMQISGLMKQHTGSENETRGSIGFVFTTASGDMKVWAEGIVMQHNPEFADSRYGATVGAARKLGTGVIVIEASLLEKVAKEIAVGYSMPVGSYLVLSPEVRFVMKENGDNETVVGIRARLSWNNGRQGPKVGPR
jgi:hypothetical protein